MGTAKRERQKQNRAQRREVDARASRNSLIRKRVIKWTAIAAVIVGGVFILTQVTGNDKETATTTPQDLCPATTGLVTRVDKFNEAPPMCIDETKTYTATFKTSEGDIVVELDTKNTPNTVNNFVVLSRYRYYENSKFFRTDTSLDIIQGGGQDNTATPGYTIPDEGSGYTYEEGDLVMARTSEPNSAGGQFFFVTGPNGANLNGQGTYVVFGRVTEGLEILKNIMKLNVPTQDGLGGKPSRDVIVSSVEITES